ncbi:hypothetical protein CBM2587_B90336 [Cupriavidus taiwanensis]|uniref:Uncharacterized protein n=1 Tax=Cupriavidus taiwanensis TaxID=164546 RepID=A0A375CCW9_9BURK|nr:hypothetical protein CBM2587_B90336 [Cupriavidus taiwanensis]
MFKVETARSRESVSAMTVSVRPRGGGLSRTIVDGKTPGVTGAARCGAPCLPAARVECAICRRRHTATIPLACVG